MYGTIIYNANERTGNGRSPYDDNQDDQESYDLDYDLDLEEEEEEEE